MESHAVITGGNYKTDMRYKGRLVFAVPYYARNFLFAKISKYFSFGIYRVIFIYVTFLAGSCAKSKLSTICVSVFSCSVLPTIFI